MAKNIILLKGIKNLLGNKITDKDIQALFTDNDTALFSFTATADTTNKGSYPTTGGTAECTTAMASGDSNKTQIGDQTFYKFDTSSGYSFTLENGVFSAGDIVKITLATKDKRSDKGVVLNNNIILKDDFEALTPKTLEYIIQSGDAIDGTNTIKLSRNDSDIRFGTIIVERISETFDPNKILSLEGLTDYDERIKAWFNAHLLFKVETVFVNTLPNTGDKNKIYLVPNGTADDKNLKDEYLWIDDKWERIGNTKIDLSGYYTKSEIDAKVPKFHTVTFRYDTGKEICKLQVNAGGFIPALPQVDDDPNRNTWGQVNLADYTNLKQDVIIERQSFDDMTKTVVKYIDGVMKYVDNNEDFANTYRIVSVALSDDTQDFNNISKFGYCRNLSSITLSKNLQNIGRYGMYYCTSLKSLTIPEGVQRIEEEGISMCSSLISIHLPNSLTIIEGRGLAGCSSLFNINFPENLRSIGNDAFSGCSSLENINLPDSLQSIGNKVFSGCSSLKTISLPDGLQSIGDNAFESCSHLKNITIPQNIQSIGKDIFNQDYKLEVVVFKSENIDVVNNFANNINNKANSSACTIYLNKSKQTQLTNATATLESKGYTVVFE